MYAIVVDPEVEGRLVIQEVEGLSPAPAEAIVRVSTLALNLGEVRTALLRASAGWRPGWEFAGVVEQAAIDGSGPVAGTRVFGMVNSGAWAEQVAVPTTQLAEIPEQLSFVQAATLPVAGQTALYGLERGVTLLNRKLLVTGGPGMMGHLYRLGQEITLENRKVLVTGASGAVGFFACQMAKQMGATVVALVRREERAAPVRARGIDEIVVGEDVTQTGSSGPYDLIIDTLGGQSLQSAFPLLANNGICVNLGAAENPEITVQDRFNARKHEHGLFVRSIESGSMANDLQRVARMAAAGHLVAQIGLEAPWMDIATVAQQLLDRRIAGRAILHVA